MKLIAPQDIQESDLGWIQKSIPGSEPFGFTASLVLDLIFAGKADLWRFQSPATGVVVTRFLSMPNGKYLEVWWTAARGLLENFDQMEALMDYARETGCIGLLGEVTRKGMLKVYEKHYAVKRLGLGLMLEVKDGR